MKIDGNVQVSGETTIKLNSGTQLQVNGSVTVDNKSSLTIVMNDAVSDGQKVVVVTSNSSVNGQFGGVEVEARNEANKCQQVSGTQQQEGNSLSVVFSVKGSCGLSTGAIVGIAVGAAVVVAAAIVIPLSIRRYRMRKRLDKHLQKVGQMKL